MANFHLTPDAKADLAAIWHYSEQNWSAEQADSYIDSLVRQFDQLVTMPEIGRAFPEIGKDLRIPIFQTHFIMYEQQYDRIVIVRILSGNQNWISLLSKLD